MMFDETQGLISVRIDGGLCPFPIMCLIAPMIGEAISRYEILEKSGEGSMGVYYKALDTTLEEVPTMVGWGQTNRLPRVRRRDGVT